MFCSLASQSTNTSLSSLSLSLILIIPTNNPSLYLHPPSLPHSHYSNKQSNILSLSFSPILSTSHSLSLVLHGHFAEQILHLTPPCLSHSQLVDRHRVVIHVQLKHAIAHRFVRLIMELREILVIQRLFHRDSLLRIDHQHATQ